MNIPEKFTINGQTINVEVVDELDSEDGIPTQPKFRVFRWDLM